jgi:hypothetical protein
VYTVSKTPCKSCPYRRDVPSGVWAEAEYDKLPPYDGDVPEQLDADAGGLFMCHQQDGKLCAGWVGCHGARNLLAMRLSASAIERSVWTYRSPVPLFKSGAAASAHGKRAMRRPGPKAKLMIRRLMRSRRS